MAPHKFQKVEVDQHEPQTQKDAQPRAVKYGERAEIVTVPYRDSPKYFPSVNVTVNPAELQRGIAKQKQDVAKTVAENQEYRRVPKGERTLTHKLPDDETTNTTRLEH